MSQRTQTPRGAPSHNGAALRTTPADGDIVIREELRGAMPVYILHTAPGADQDEFETCNGAIAHAMALAERHQVRLWLTDEGYDFLLLEDFRVTESI